MSTLIVTGGSIKEEAVSAYLTGRCFEHVIAVDAGAVEAKRLGLSPDYVVGDFDTLGTEGLKEWEAMSGVTVRRYCPQKDETDTEIAVKMAIDFERGRKEATCRRHFFPEQVVLLGATGTRLDHTLANIFMLEQFETAGISACIVDANNRISVHHTGFSFSKEEVHGKYISFLALSADVKNLTLHGFCYPLEEHTLVQESSLCVSNEACEKSLQVEFADGRLLMVESQD